MKPEITGALCNAAIPFFGGIYATLLAYRVVGKRVGEDPRYDAWHEKYGGTLKILGPLVAIFGVFLLFTDVLRARQ